MTELHRSDARRAHRGPARAPLLQRRAHAAFPRAHRALQPGAERLHHRDRRAGARGCAAGPISRSAAGEAVPLTGLPLVHKDIFCTDGVLTTCGSRMLSNFVAPYDATVVERLSQAGVVMLGKTNMDEFAMGSSNETSWYGPVTQPVGSEEGAGRLVGRFGGRRRGAPGARGDRHRHRRLDPPAGGAHRPDRLQADLRPRVALRNDRVRVEPRSGRRADADGRGRGDAARRTWRASIRATRPASIRRCPTTSARSSSRSPV